MKQNLNAFIYPDSGGYVAECPDLHAVTQGDTLDETVANLREVISLALEDEDFAELGLALEPTLVVTVELEPLKRAS